jgi:DNA-binding HxlR family transcriptional regulator
MNAHPTATVPCTAVENRPGCIQAALTILGDKWSPLLLGLLVDGPKTFGELEESLAGISPKTLSERLARLCGEQVVAKHMYHQHPPRYRYELTAKGRGLEEILRAMATWGDKYHTEA